jgi:peptidoglycan-associated lipoprotein
MNKSLLMSVLLAAVLSACSNNAVKNKPAAPVVDSAQSAQTASAEAEAARLAVEKASEASDLAALKDPNNILSKRSIYFDFDKDEVKPEYRALVDAHAKFLLAHPKSKVAIQGNADNRGSREYNLSLGQRRSVAVKKAMNLAGVQEAQIETVSYGEEKANACKDEACFQQDRRADIVYDHE